MESKRRKVGDRLRNQTEMKTWQSLGQVDGGALDR